MNATQERAREACDSCRKSHKKCTYDDNSTSCERCDKRGAPCSLFLSVQTTVVAQPGPPAMAAAGSAPGSWAGTPHDISATSSNFPYQFPSQGSYYWPGPTTTDFTEAVQGECTANTVFPPHANQHENEQPLMNQDGLYGYNNNNVFGDHA